MNGLNRQPLPSGHADHDDLASLEQDLLWATGGEPLFEEKLRGFFRSAIDEVIDTARTGRFFFRELEKTEKTYLGTKFEILLRDWLQVPRGVVLDLLIGGREVDVKSTTARFGWMIPPEAVNQLCILLAVNEADACCSVGLICAKPDYLNRGANRDAKTTIAAAGRANIWWLARDFGYTPNFWSLIPEESRSEIMSLRGGTKRLALLFERHQQLPVSRVQISAIAQQDDFMKRVRGNGGARDLLKPKGIAILYSENDREIMSRLGLRFGAREFMSYAPANSEEARLLREAGRID